jgi:hypothetical protein
LYFKACIEKSSKSISDYLGGGVRSNKQVLPKIRAVTGWNIGLAGGDGVTVASMPELLNHVVRE